MLEKLIEIISTHEKAKLLAFRVLRKSNFPIGEKECLKKKIEVEKNSELAYYDITIPYINAEGKEDILRLEIDKYELEALVKKFSEALGEED
jgi:hypothetical protein